MVGVVGPMLVCECVRFCAVEIGGGGASVEVASWVGGSNPASPRTSVMSVSSRFPKCQGSLSRKSEIPIIPQT